MPSHSETRILPYPPKALFDLVADIEKYPEFLPWCAAARILRREGEGIIFAELLIHFSKLRESYTSRVTLEPPEGGAPGKIIAELVEGPFSHLLNRWEFIPQDGGTRLEFFLDFGFKSRILEGLIGGVFRRATDEMVQAFEKRAALLAGKY